jgi:hypothetical protein
MITESEWVDFAANALPGDLIVYYRGRTPSGSSEVFRIVGAAADAGDFSLTQKIVVNLSIPGGEGRIFEYRAERISAHAWTATDNLRRGPDLFSAFCGGSA